MSDETPAVRRGGHFLEAVLRPGETLASIGKRVEFCEITWPQCYVMGEPIRIYTEDKQ
jgi:hypothetical protein